jgi:protein TonB
MKASTRKPIIRKNDIKKGYTLRLQIGMILSLLIFIGLFKLEFYPEITEVVFQHTTELIQVEEIERTRQEPITPPPPRPVVPVAVPNDEIIVDEQILFSTDMTFDDIVALPPPPPSATQTEEEEEEIFVLVEQMPELIGGLAAVQSKIKYPEVARLAGIEGRVVLQFVIDEKGNVNDPVIIRGIGGGCDEEALRAIKEVKFVPGMQRGRPVKVRYSLPVTFSLTVSNNNS